MRYFLYFLLILSTSVFAGGDSFDIKVIEFSKTDNVSARLIFVPLSTPYGKSFDQFLNGHNEMIVEIGYACSQGLACFTTKPTFTLQQHKDAIYALSKIALPDEKVTIGVMSSGFEAIEGKPGHYRSNGAVIINDTVYLYFNSHI